MSHKAGKHSGFSTVEIIVVFAVLGSILFAMAVSLHGFGKFNRYQMVRQRCIAAAQAQLDSITARHEFIKDADLERLWPGVSVALERSQGTGQWKGLELVRATAKAKAGQKQTMVVLSRYVLPAEPVSARE